MPTLPTGISRTSRGFRTFVWVPDAQRPKGRLATKRWPATATTDEMERWREEQRELARAPKPIADQPIFSETGFAADAVRYLEAVQAMPSYRSRAHDIAIWVLEFENTPRPEITPAMIRTRRDRWLTVGPKSVLERSPEDGKARWVLKPLPLAASTVNHRLRALENLYTVLDGRGARNPVRDVPEASEPELEPRDVPYDIVRAILEALPDRTRPVKGQKRGNDSKSKARLEVMAYTGLSPAQLKRVQPDDLKLDGPAKTLYMRPRKKGRSVRLPRGITVPLLPQAARAFKRFAALDCWGEFSQSSLGKSFRRACRALNLPDTIKPYDLRHSFGTVAFAQSGDLATTGALLGHRDPRTTTRYTLGAVDHRLATVVRSMRRQTARKASLKREASAPIRRGGEGRKRAG